MHTSNGFDPNAYKLMKRFGYDFSKPTSLKLSLTDLMTNKRWYKIKGMNLQCLEVALAT